MIEKISELKERHLHIRNVILQFIRSLNLKASKKETEGIITVLSEYFEYSEEERGVFLQKESGGKKFWGIL